MGLFTSHEAMSPGESPLFQQKHSPWAKQSSYNGCDIIPICVGRDRAGKDQIFTIGDISTLSYSIHMDKGAVRTLGRNRMKGMTKGPITIAGSMIFNLFDRRALWEISKDKAERTKRVIIAHQLPPFDIILNFTNEYGLESNMAIYGIEIMDEGQTHSIEDIYTENTMSYIARDIDLIEPKNSKGGIPQGGIFLAKRREEAYTGLGSTQKPFDYSYQKRV